MKALSREGHCNEGGFDSKCNRKPLEGLSREVTEYGLHSKINHCGCYVEIGMKTKAETGQEDLQ